MSFGFFMDIYGYFEDSPYIFQEREQYYTRAVLY